MSQRSCSSHRISASYGRDLGHPGHLSISLPRCVDGSNACACSTSIRLRFQIRSSTPSSQVERRISICRCSTFRRRCSGGCDDTGIRAIRRTDCGHPRPRPRRGTTFVIHPRLSGETEEDHDALLGFLDEAQLDWVASSRTQRRRAPTPPTSMRRCRGTWPSSDCANVQIAGSDNRSPPDRPHRYDLRGTRRRPGDRSLAPGGARDRRGHPLPADLAVGSLVFVDIVDAEGPDCFAVPSALRGPDSERALAGERGSGGGAP